MPLLKLPLNILAHQLLSSLQIRGWVLNAVVIHLQRTVSDNSSILHLLMSLIFKLLLVGFTTMQLSACIIYSIYLFIVFIYVDVCMYVFLIDEHVIFTELRLSCLKTQERHWRHSIRKRCRRDLLLYEEVIRILLSKRSMLRWRTDDY